MADDGRRAPVLAGGLVLLAATVLAACGGGSTSAPSTPVAPSPPPVPSPTLSEGAYFLQLSAFGPPSAGAPTLFPACSPPHAPVTSTQLWVTGEVRRDGDGWRFSTGDAPGQLTLRFAARPSFVANLLPLEGNISGAATHTGAVPPVGPQPQRVSIARDESGGEATFTGVMASGAASGQVVGRIVFSEVDGVRTCPEVGAVLLPARVP